VRQHLDPDGRTLLRIARVAAIVEDALAQSLGTSATLHPIGSAATGNMLRGCADFDASVIFKSISDGDEPERVLRQVLPKLVGLLGPVKIRERRVGSHSVFNFRVNDVKVSLGATVWRDAPNDCFEEIPHHPRFVGQAANDSLAYSVRLFKLILIAANADSAFPGFAVERLLIEELDIARLIERILDEGVTVIPINSEQNKFSPNRELSVSYLYFAEDLLARVTDVEISRLLQVLRTIRSQGPRKLIEKATTYIGR